MSEIIERGGHMSERSIAEIRHLRLPPGPAPGGPVLGFRPVILDVQPDPRISNQRPGWLADDEQWRDQLQAMDLDEIRWVEKHWDMAGGAGPAVVTSWLQMERIGTGVPAWPIVLCILGLIACFGVLTVLTAVGVLR